ncbi:MAG: pentapeptide repeat-containing protein [Lachnospiraceae bacterium]|nr:pentapeptide repeat-containing protein [Lachnospiraceae bacterium]
MLNNCTFSGCELSGCVFSCCVFSGCVFSGCVFSGCSTGISEGCSADCSCESCGCGSGVAVSCAFSWGMTSSTVVSDAAFSVNSRASLSPEASAVVARPKASETERSTARMSLIVFLMMRPSLMHS